MPNIRSEKQDHQFFCTNRINPYSFLNDVRECPHGKLQVYSYTWGWQDISPFWSRKKYNKALKALGVDSE